MSENLFQKESAIPHFLHINKLKMILHAAIVLLFATTISNAQIYFPGDPEMEKIQISSAAAVAPDLSAIRGTSTYEQEVDRIISTGVLKLTLAIQKALKATSTEESDAEVYAPVSIAGALALILMGSNGKTFQEISEIMGLATGVVDIQDKSQLVHEQFGRMIQNLQFTSGFDIGRQVRFATAIFLQEGYPIRNLYKTTAETIYESSVLNVDFEGNPEQAKNKINSWVSTKTSGKIKDMLSENPSSATKVILTSAMYFNAPWEKPFIDGSTKRRPFFTNGRKSKSEVMVEMMSNGGDFPYYKDRVLNCEILGLPYKGNHTTMYIVMPFNSNKDKLKELENKLTDSDVERMINNLNYTGALILFPKMHIDTTLNLRKSLQAIGVKSLFDPTEANLALISPGGILNKHPVIPSAALPNRNEEAAEELFIFSRSGATSQPNCSEIFDPSSPLKSCNESAVTYKKFGNKVGRRIVSNRISNLTETLDNIRHSLNQHPNPDKYENPGLYVDTVIHKVYMDITETGTEAAAATAASLSRNGGRVTFRVDVPFLFFVLHENTKTVLFWGSVDTPTPSFK